MPELFELTALEMANAIRSKETTPADCMDAMLARTAAVESRIQAFLTITPEGAAPADRAAALNGASPLAGVPMALKDNLCTRGIRTTCGSRILPQWVPPYDATVAERLYRAGCPLLGKLNMDEFAMGSSTENSGFQVTRNPWNLDCVPGGSSGGAAAAVAASEAPFALGSDTGGSIRQPASFCGIVGLKPTYGRVSRYGLVAYASSLDQIGPITKDVRDCAAVLATIAGHDPLDSTSVPRDVPDYLAGLRTNVRGLRLGKPRQYFGPGIDAAVRDAVDAAIDLLVSLGATCEEVDMPYTEYALPVYYLIAPSECSSNLARYDGVRYGYRAPGDLDMVEMFLETRDQGFGAEVKRRIMLGTYALSAGYYDAYYLKAQKVRTLVKRDFERAWERFDVLITPTSPTVAFKVGEKVNDPLAMYLSDICTIPVNLAGLPAVSLPCGFSVGLPIGLQIIGQAFDEETLLRVAYTYEQSTDWHKRRAQL